MRHSFTPGEIRRRLDESVRTGAALDAFFIDHFPAVARELTPGMTRIERVNLLLQMEPDLARIASCLAADEPSEGRAPRSASRYWLPGLALFATVVGLCGYLLMQRPRSSSPGATPVLPPAAAVAQPVPPQTAAVAQPVLPPAAAVAQPVLPSAAAAQPASAPVRPSPPQSEPKRHEPLRPAQHTSRSAGSVAPAGINRDNQIVDSPGASMHNRSPAGTAGAGINSGNRIENSPGAQMTNEVTAP